MLGFFKKCFITGVAFLWSVNLLAVTSLRCVSMNNKKCKVRPEIVNVNSDEHVFYPFSIKTNKCSGSWKILKIHMQKCLCFWCCKKIKC